MLLGTTPEHERLLHIESLVYDLRPHNSSLRTGKPGKCTPTELAEGSKWTRLHVIADSVLRCGCAVI